jgi:hypothetical protein
MSQTPLKEDYLEVDPPIPGQNYVCLSFVSPEDMIRKKTIFEARRFVEYILARTKETVIPEEHLTVEQAVQKLNMDGYLDYAVSCEEENTKLFNEENESKTSVRGIKVRGVFESLKEAQRKAKVLQTRDPTFHVFVGQVGYWLPWDPNPDNVENQEYAEHQLNEIVKKYKENKQAKDEVWDKDIKKRIEATKADGQRGALDTAKLEVITEDNANGSDGTVLKEEQAKEMVKNIFDSEDVFLARQKE